MCFPKMGVLKNAKKKSLRNVQLLNKNPEKGNTVSQNMVICKEQQRMLCFGSAVH